MRGRDVQSDDRAGGGHEVVEIVGAIARDAAQLVEQHAQLLKAELSEGLHDSAAAAAAVAAGAGLVAAGGVMGSMMLVHGLHRASRMPLWGCYGIVGGVLATVGLRLLGSGARRAGSVTLVPRETLAALREDFQWIADRARTRTS